MVAPARSRQHRAHGGGSVREASRLISRELQLQKCLLIALILISLAAGAHEGHHHGPSRSHEAKETMAPAPVKDALVEINKNYLANVGPIFERKCADCHWAGRAEPWYASLPIAGWVIEGDRREAKEHLEISRGFPFAGHGTPAEDLDAIIKVVDKDSMPTALYRFFHPAQRLTADERSRVLAWARGARAQLGADSAPR